MGFANLLKAKSETTQIVKTPGRNVALEVVSYDLEKNTVTGFNLETGETETISLRPDLKTRGHERADVKTWSGNGKSGKRNVAYTEIGGVIVFESVYTTAQGTTAKWGTSYSHTPDESIVMVLPAMPFVTVNKSYGMQQIDTTQSKIVSTVQELKEAFSWAVEPSPYSSALIRIHEKDDAGNHIITSLKNHKNQLYGRAKLVDDKYITMTPEEAAAFFLTTSDGEILMESIGQGYVTEILSADKIFFGKDTRSSLGEEDHFVRNYLNSDGKIGFAKSIVAARRHKEGGLFLSAEPIPTSTSPHVFSLENLVTQKYEVEYANN